MNNNNFSARVVNEREFKRTLTRDFPDFTRFAVANTASRIAFLGLEKSETQLRQEFNLKNRFLVSGTPGKGVIQFNRAIPHHDLNKITSSWGTPYKRGSTDLDFMEDQETGFTHEGSTPTLNARVGNNRNKVIKNNLRRYHIELMDTRGVSGKDSKQKMLILLRQAYINSYGMPGSKQFIYIHKGEFGRFREGMYQFKSKSITGLNSFPQIKGIYYSDGKNKARKATHWMEDSKNKITQYDIDNIYLQEFNKAFTRGIKRSW